MTTVQIEPNYKVPAYKAFWKTIAWVGLLAGTLDIMSACLQAYLVRGISPVTVLQYIASAAFGKAAYSGGITMTLTGLLFHYIIAYSFTILFFVLYPYLKFMGRSIVLTAIGYGIFIFIVMNQLVLPLTKVPPIVFKPDKAAIATGILIVAIGLPLSIFARKFYQGKG